MKAACDKSPGTMAAVLGLEDSQVKSICEATPGTVIAANFNCPGQLVISGEQKAVENACKALSEAGAKRTLILPVGGAFHSPLMEPAKTELAKAIDNTPFKNPSCPVYQNVTSKGTLDVDLLKINLIAQLTAPVRWTQSVQQMIADGATSFTEVGPGKVLQGLIKKINRNTETLSGTL
jgi:[acyl-carrier-protein] S-malonyltransferase